MNGEISNSSAMYIIKRSYTYCAITITMLISSIISTCHFKCKLINVEFLLYVTNTKIYLKTKTSLKDEHYTYEDHFS